jgi:hypothetical protein
LNWRDLRWELLANEKDGRDDGEMAAGLRTDETLQIACKWSDTKNSWVVLSNTASCWKRRTLPPKLAYVETCISKANNKLKAGGWEKIAEEVQTSRIWVGAKDESWAITSMEREKGEGTMVIALREKVKQEGPYIGRKES